MDAFYQILTTYSPKSSKDKKVETSQFYDLTQAMIGIIPIMFHPIEMLYKEDNSIRFWLAHNEDYNARMESVFSHYLINIDKFRNEFAQSFEYVMNSIERKYLHQFVLMKMSKYLMQHYYYNNELTESHPYLRIWGRTYEDISELEPLWRADTSRFPSWNFLTFKESFFQYLVFRFEDHPDFEFVVKQNIDIWREEGFDINTFKKELGH